MDMSAAEFTKCFGINEPTEDPMPDYDAYEKEGLPINEIQRLQFELLRRVEYNELDGARVVADLLEWRELWYAAFGDRCAASTGKRYEQVVDLIRLRDLPRNFWNVDIVFIWTDSDKVDHLKTMIKQRWRADAIDLLSQEEMERYMMSTIGKDDRVIAVWWD